MIAGSALLHNELTFDPEICCFAGSLDPSGLPTFVICRVSSYRVKDVFYSDWRVVCALMNMGVHKKN